MCNVLLVLACSGDAGAAPGLPDRAGLSVAWGYDVPPPATDTPFLRRTDRPVIGPTVVRVSGHRHMDWVAGGSINIHGAQVHGAGATAFDIATAVGGPLFLTNRVNSTSLRLASHVTLARCVVAGINGNPAVGGGNNRTAQCSQNVGAYPAPHDPPCICPQDMFLPNIWQHVIIDSVPTYGPAPPIKRSPPRGAAPVVPAVSIKHFRAAPGVMAASKSDCGLRRDGSREWLFAGQGREIGLAHGDCPPVGTLDWYRRSQAAVAPGAALVYASRGGGGGRGPVAADANDLEVWLRALSENQC